MSNLTAQQHYEKYRGSGEKKEPSYTSFHSQFTGKNALKNSFSKEYKEEGLKMREKRISQEKKKGRMIEKKLEAHKQ